MNCKVFNDNRGSFNQVVQFLGGFTIAQVNHSYSYEGVWRGLHQQLSPRSQEKWVYVVSGAIIDFAVSLREPDFGEVTVEFLEEHSLVKIPNFCAHGFFARKTSHVIYFTDVLFSPPHEISITPFSVPKIDEILRETGIKLSEAIMSDKDKFAMTLARYKEKYL